MSFVLISVLTTLGGILLYFIMGAVVKAPGTVLATKFASLGDMSGKTYAEIKRVVGTENSVSRKVLDDGQVVTIRQWMATGYHIVLLFDGDDNFIGISNEISV